MQLASVKSTTRRSTLKNDRYPNTGSWFKHKLLAYMFLQLRFLSLSVTHLLVIEQKILKITSQKRREQESSLSFRLFLINCLFHQMRTIFEEFSIELIILPFRFKLCRPVNRKKINCESLSFDVTRTIRPKAKIGLSIILFDFSWIT